MSKSILRDMVEAAVPGAHRQQRALAERIHTAVAAHVWSASRTAVPSCAPAAGMPTRSKEYSPIKVANASEQDRVPGAAIFVSRKDNKRSNRDGFHSSVHRSQTMAV